MLKDAGRGWLLGKGLKRQRVPVAAGDVVLWDSRLVHQGGQRGGQPCCGRGGAAASQLPRSHGPAPRALSPLKSL